jgi:serine protease Do
MHAVYATRTIKKQSQNNTTWWAVRWPSCVVAVLVFVANSLLGTTSANAQEFEGLAVFAAIEDSITKIVKKSEKSVVAISRIRNRNVDLIPRERARNPFGIQDPVQSSNPSGKNFFPKDFATGIVVAPKDRPRDRLILTNYHSVKGGPSLASMRKAVVQRAENQLLPIQNATATHRLYVRFNRHQSAEAAIYAADPRSDLAVLAILPLGREVMRLDEIPAISLDVTPEIKKGQFCISLNNPFAIARDGSPSVSIGLISNVSRFPYAESRQDKIKSIHFYGTLLHVDTRLGPGASGGALLNRKGELIGITTSMTAIRGYESNVGFAIPFNKGTRRIVDELIQGFEVEYGFLGVKLSAEKPTVRTYGNRFPQRVGVVADKVVPNSPASRGGLQNGDIILRVGKQLLLDEDDLFREVGLQGPGTIANMRIMRGEQELNLQIRLGKWPTINSDQIIVAKHRIPEWRGMKVDWPTSRQKYVDYEKPYPRAVVVTNVKKDSPAHVAGLREEDLIASVNDRAVETPVEFANAIRNLTGEVRLRTNEGKEIIVHR